MIVLSTGSLYNRDISHAFQLAADAGFDGMEVLVDARVSSRDPVYLRRLSAAHGLPIVSLHSPFVPEVPGWPSDNLGRLKRTVSLARETGAKVVCIHLPLRLCGVEGRFSGCGYHPFRLPLPWFLKGPYYHFLQNGRLQEMEAETGVIIALENMPAQSVLNLTINAYWFNRIREFDRFTHMTMDTTHLGTWGYEPVSVYERLKEKVVHVHLSNYDGREHRLPTDGRLPLAALLRSMRRNGYAGALCVETSPDALFSEDENRCRATLDEVLAFCRTHF